MTLAAGTRIGPYEIISLLGSGGMGEVYRARDARLQRDVALKVMSKHLVGDPERLRRFQQEAEVVAALSHPNLVALYDVGTSDGGPYLVSELLEGQTLRDRLAGGPFPIRRAIEIAIQVARGLDAAHEKGIVHRDLKPENLFLTRDGRTKVLDFGLARLVPLPMADPGPAAGSITQTIAPATGPGVILGTVGYMAPEQVRGRPADPRSDLFALGSVLYEMLCGRRAFRLGSAIETMNAILTVDPPPLSASSRTIPPSLERIVRRCLEKNPEQRYQSARDLAFGLEALSDPSGLASSPKAGGPSPEETSSRRRWLILTGAGLAAAAPLACGVWIGRLSSQHPIPEFSRQSFRRGTIPAARFAPDGHTILFSASWEGDPVEIFLTRQEYPETRRLGLPGIDLLASSPTGELAVVLDRHLTRPSIWVGTLARMPLVGGIPRPILEGVQWADWSPDGRRLAIVRDGGGRNRLEFPIGTVLFRAEGWISHPRVSPGGDRVAFLHHPKFADDKGSLVVVDLTGRARTLAEFGGSLWGLAWSATGSEVWITAADTGAVRTLRAVDLAGRARLVLRSFSNLTLHDIHRGGDVLLTHEESRRGILALPPGAGRERSLSWLDASVVTDLSPDGTTMLFYEEGEGGGPEFATYLRRTDGSPAVRLGQGAAVGLSPDGRWALTIRRTEPPRLVLLPTGAGEPRLLETGPITVYHWATWLPDGRRIAFTGGEPGHAARIYLQGIDGGPPRPISAEGISFLGLARPDGRSVAAVGPDRRPALYPLEGGSPRPIPGLEPGDIPLRWAADGGSLFALRIDEPTARVVRVDLATGTRTPFQTFVPADPAGVTLVGPIVLTPDGTSYAYSVSRVLSDLFVVRGLR